MRGIRAFPINLATFLCRGKTFEKVSSPVQNFLNFFIKFVATISGDALVTYKKVPHNMRDHIGYQLLNVLLVFNRCSDKIAE